MNIKVTIRHIGAIETDKEKGGKAAAAVHGSKVEWTSHFGWQGKKFSPNELLKYSNAGQEKKGGLFRSHQTITEAEYIEDIKHRMEGGEKVIVSCS